jgi:hypothetical protein
MAIRSLTIAERVLLRRAHAQAIEFCRFLSISDDKDLLRPVRKFMNTRPTGDRLHRIRGEYNLIKDKLLSLNPESDTAFCRDEGDPSYAYVDQNDDQIIYLGDYFFLANRLGDNCCAGVLIHEVSHFRSVLGTDDYAYGANTLNLPFSQGRRNADSYEYIAEHIAKYYSSL